MKLVTILLFTLAVAVFAKTRSNAITGLYGTGLYEDGSRVTFGEVDPHWTLSGLVYTGQQPIDTTVWPGGVPSSLPAPLFVVDSQKLHGRSGPCNNTDYSCYWISPVSIASVPLPGSYFYYIQTTFNIDKLVNSEFSLSISAADTVKAILINGVDTAAVEGSSDTNREAFANNGPDRYTTFSFDNTHGEFRRGTNTLEVVVEHAYGTPVGISVGIMSVESKIVSFRRASPNIVDPTPGSCVQRQNASCNNFNIYTPGSPLPDGYQDLTSIFPNIVLDENGQITLPCVPTLSATGLFVPEVLSVTYSYYGQPLCAVVVDCNMAGSGDITVTATNVNRAQSYSFTALELCSNEGVFFGCIDTAYGSRFTPPVTGNNGETLLTGEFSDTIQIQYTDTEGLMSNAYKVYLTCGNAPGFNFSTISELLLVDAFEENIERLLALRSQITYVQTLLFDNSENVPCAEIAQATDLASTALDFFNFLDCLGNRELSEDAFLYSLENRNSTQNPSGLCLSQ